MANSLIAVTDGITFVPVFCDEADGAAAWTKCSRTLNISGSSIRESVAVMPLVMLRDESRVSEDILTVLLPLLEGALKLSREPQDADHESATERWLSWLDWTPGAEDS